MRIRIQESQIYADPDTKHCLWNIDGISVLVIKTLDPDRYLA
jgi:hypothetical protein